MPSSGIIRAPSCFASCRLGNVIGTGCVSGRKLPQPELCRKNADKGGIVAETRNRLRPALLMQFGDRPRVEQPRPRDRPFAELSAAIEASGWWMLDKAELGRLARDHDAAVRDPTMEALARLGLKNGELA